MNIQAIDLVEIGAGGGSIAHARLGVIAVGPRVPRRRRAPLCYGRGGVEPTVTDADVVLGYINPDYFAGGSMRLERRGGARDRGEDRAAARPVARGRSVGHPRDRQHQHGAGHAHRVDRARPRSPRSHPGRLRRLGPGPRLPARAGPRHSTGDSSGLRRRHGRDRAARRRGAIRRRARRFVRRLDAVDPDHLTTMYAEMAGQAIEVVRESAVAGK